MTFNDIAFIFCFLPVCILGFVLAGRFGRTAAVGYLALSSFVFYSYWSRVYLLLLLASILFNFLTSILLERTAGDERKQTAVLIAGIAINLGALAYFKYLFPLLQFFTDSGLTHRHWGSIVLPLGISFFTFTQIAYLVDLKQGVATRESFVSYLFFVTFFPHLVAGPILHHKEIMPQVRENRRYGLDSDDVALGITWFTLGLFKKVVIADRIAHVPDEFYFAVGHPTAYSSWLAVVTYALQLYFDFSGYSDMALGLARIFSIRFPINFDSPFKAGSIIEFWQRWHMTLTRYVMDYLYSPILFWVSRRRIDRGQKVSMKAQATVSGFTQMVALPTLFTMFVVGVWHGPALHYFAYGLCHGVYITANHLWRKKVPVQTALRRFFTGPLAVVVTFLSVVLSFVLFRAASLHDAARVFAGMTGVNGLGAQGALHGKDFPVMVFLIAVVWLLPNTQEILGEQQREDWPNWALFLPRHFRPTIAWCLATTGLFLVAASCSNSQSVFLYFQF